MTTRLHASIVIRVCIYLGGCFFAGSLSAADDNFSLGNAASGSVPDPANTPLIGDGQPESLFGDESPAETAQNAPLNNPQAIQNPANTGTPNGGAVPGALTAPPSLLGTPEKTPEAPKQSFDGPLRTDGSVAPIKNLTPIAPNDFAGVPPLPGSRKNLARDQAPESYTVEQGDTLFDICSQLIDDGNYWPRLWALNADIKNPHFVYPGMTLKFFPGDNVNPPFLDVVEEDEMTPVDKGDLKEADLIAQTRDFTSTSSNLSYEKQDTEVIGPEAVNVDSEILDRFVTGGNIYNGASVTFIVPVFVVAEEKDELGVVESGLEYEIMAGDGIKVAIDTSEQLAIGGVYTVLRPQGSVTHPLTEDMVGYRYDFTANIKITRKYEDSSYEGLIQNSYLGVRQGDIVVPFISTKRVVQNTSVGQINTADATIIALATAGQVFAGEGSLVVLDKGGLAAGNFYGIFQKNPYTTTTRDEEATDAATSSAVGAIKVIDSNQQTSTGIVVSNSREIRLGDMTTPKY